MKRLFEVNGQFFDSKFNAKVARGAPTKGADGNKPPEYGSTIRLGPDHFRFGEVKTPTRASGDRTATSKKKRARGHDAFMSK